MLAGKSAAARGTLIVLLTSIFVACGAPPDPLALPPTVAAEVSAPASAVPPATAPPVAPPTALPASPIPEPILPTEAPAPGAAAQVAAIVDGETGFLIGGAQGGGWLDAGTTAQLLAGNERYRLYAGAADLGTAIGGKPAAEVGGPCQGTQVVTLDPRSQRRGALAVSAGWNVLPRIPEDLSPQADVYRVAIGELLRANGIDQPEVQLIRVLRIDLEGVGVDEVLIGATRLANGTQAPPVAAGDYSLVVLRKLSGGQVVTIPLIAHYYPQAQELAYPDEHTVAAVLDFNGDGRQEIGVHSARYEGGFMSVYEVAGLTAQDVLRVGCSE